MIDEYRTVCLRVSQLTKEAPTKNWVKGVRQLSVNTKIRLTPYQLSIHTWLVGNGTLWSHQGRPITKLLGTWRGRAWSV